MALDTTGALGPMLSYRFYVSDDRSNGWVPRGNSHTTALGGSLRLDVDPTLSFSLDYDYGRQEPARYFGVPVENGQLNPALRFQNYNVADAASPYYDQWTRLNTTWRAAPGITLHNQLYYLLTNRHWHDSESYSLMPDGNVLRSDYIEILHHEKQVGDTLDATFDGHLWGHRNRAVVGADFNVISFLDTSNSPFDGSSVVPAFNFDPGVFMSAGSDRARVPHDNASGVAVRRRPSRTDRPPRVGERAALRPHRFSSRHVRDHNPAASSFDKTFAHTGWRTGLVLSLTPEPLGLCAVHDRHRRRELADHALAVE